MPRASKRPVNQSVQAELQENFSFLISSLSASADIQHFFETFLTEEEKIMLSKRLMLHLMILNAYSITEVASVLRVSNETVYKHSHIVRMADSIYKSVVAKISKRRKIKEFWKQVENILRPVGLMLQAKTNMKARAKLLTADYD